jgi:hypothetical protein
MLKKISATASAITVALWRLVPWIDRKFDAQAKMPD